MAAARAGTSTDEPTIGDVHGTFDFSTSDFATIVKTTTYVDKTLMIRDVYAESSRILITAPRRFGKSTNLDMVKRFFEIEVDTLCNPKPVHTTYNYKLFKDYNLEICKDIGFLNEHFGKHPVLFIDFKPLCRVVDSANILDAFKVIIENSFNQHSYIWQSSRTEYVFSGIPGFNANDFRKYVSGITKNIDEDNLVNSFNHLSTILKRVFEKKVFVLIDSYDAFLESPLFKNNADREKMMSFVESSIGQLLNNTNCIERVLITGVIPMIGEGFLCNENSIEFHQFLHSHPFTKYYGLTSAEVDTVLSKVIECDDERRNVKNTISDYYNAYGTRNRDIRVYNVISVLQYVCRRSVQTYWCDQRYINKFRKCFKHVVVRDILEDLLLGNELQLDMSQPVSMADVFKVNSMITSGEAEPLSVEVELFFVVLHHFGFFSVIKEKQCGEICLRIPSKEIQYQLVKAIFNENRELYKCPYVNDVLLDLDAFQPDATNIDQNFKTFHKNMYNWWKNRLSFITNILQFLYVYLVRSEKYSRVMTHTLGPNGPTVVLLKNKHQVVIYLTIQDRYQSAKIVHQKVTNDKPESGEEHIFDVFNDVRGKVVIAFGLVNVDFGIAYSYYFKTGDNLQEAKTLPNRAVASHTKGYNTW